METQIWITIQQQAVVPVIVIHKAEQALPLCDALSQAGINLIEITLRTEAAIPAIKEILSQRPKMLVGAGTVLNIRQAKLALDLGCHFLVSPGMDEEMIDWAALSSIPILAGAVTPSEIMHGMRMGLDIFKFFPSHAMGGIETMKAVCDPFPQIRFIPTGGINAENMVSYLQQRFVYAVGGSWMTKADWLENGDYTRVTQEARSTLQKIQQMRETPA
jgi:2-dehydro-3-deoxyphosphogluconate aldolase/(4S)-4-hydroxy-2-oxoglutarate aldolase